MRHLGKIKNTGTRVIVIMMQLPEEKESCLVIEADSLPRRIHDAIHSTVLSSEAQSNVNLFEVLNRRVGPDGRILLTTLHQDKLIRKLPIDNILMMPGPGQQMELKDILEFANNQNNPEKLAELQKKLNDTKFNPYIHNINEDSKKEYQIMAKNLISEAELLEADAKRKRAKALELDPTLDGSDLSVNPGSAITSAV